MSDPDAGQQPASTPQPPYVTRPYAPYPAAPPPANTTETTNPSEGLIEGVLTGLLLGIMALGVGVYAQNVLLDLVGFCLVIATGAGGYGALKYRLWRDQLRHDRSIDMTRVQAVARALPVEYQTQRDIQVATEHEVTIRQRQKLAFRQELKRLKHEARFRPLEAVIEAQKVYVRLLTEINRKAELDPSFRAVLDTYKEMLTEMDAAFVPFNNGQAQTLTTQQQTERLQAILGHLQQLAFGVIQHRTGAKLRDEPSESKR